MNFLLRLRFHLVYLVKYMKTSQNPKKKKKIQNLNLYCSQECQVKNIQPKLVFVN